MFCKNLELLSLSRASVWPPQELFLANSWYFQYAGRWQWFSVCCQSYMVDFVRTKEQQGCFAVIQKQDEKGQLLLNVFLLCKISLYRAAVILALVSWLSLCGYSFCKSFCLAEKSIALVGFLLLLVSKIRNKQGRKWGTFTIFTFHVKILSSGENTCLLVAQQKQLAWICTGGRVHDSGFQELSGSVQSMTLTVICCMSVTFCTCLCCQTKLLTTIPSILGCVGNMWLGCHFVLSRSCISASPCNLPKILS